MDVRFEFFMAVKWGLSGCDTG